MTLPGFRNGLRFLGTVAWKTPVKFVEDEGFMLAGHLAFISLLSLFPFLIFLVALAGFLGQTEAGAKVVGFMFENMPEAVSGVLRRPINEVLERRSGGLLTLGIVGAIWTAASGIEAARIALNRAYDAVDYKPFWRRRLESLIIVIFAATIIVSALAVLVLGPLVWRALLQFLPALEPFSGLWAVLRYALTSAVLICAVSALYYLLPAVRPRFSWVVPGAVLTLLLWNAAGTSFALYLEHFGNYPMTYGSLGGIVIVLIFFYILAASFLFGAELNGAIRETVRGRARAKTKHPPPTD